MSAFPSTHDLHDGCRGQHSKPLSTTPLTLVLAGGHIDHQPVTIWHVPAGGTPYLQIHSQGSGSCQVAPVSGSSDAVVAFMYAIWH